MWCVRPALCCLDDLLVSRGLLGRLGLFDDRLLLHLSNLFHMMRGGDEAEVVSRCKESTVKRRLALLSYQAHCPLEHAGRCLGSLGCIIVLPLSHVCLCSKWINAQELRPLLLELSGSHAARSGRM